MMELKIDHNSNVPLYVQVEELFRKLINKPEYQDGKMLPKEVELSNKLGVSRNTIRRATDKLVNEGLLDRKKGVGTKVKHSVVNTKLDNWISYSKEMQRKGIDVINYNLITEWQTVSSKVARALNLKKGTKILCLKRLRGTHDEPILYSIDYFHPRLNLSQNDDFTKPLYDLINEKASVIPSVSKEKIKAELCNESLAEKLKCPVNSAILNRERIVCDPGDRPIEFNIVQYKAESFIYSIEINRN